jgi:hypothetical protein
MRPNRVQEKTLSAERSTRVAKVPKENIRIPADTFSPAQTFLFFFRRAFENRSGYFDSADARTACAEKQATRLLSAVEWISVLRENSVGNAAANRDRVNRSVLGEAA